MINATPPVGLDDDTVARVQFDHYIGQVDAVAADGWPTVRRQLAEALEAAGSGIAVRVGHPLTRELLRVAGRRRRLAVLIDETRRHHPDAACNEFRRALYQAWRSLDNDGNDRS